MGLHQVLMVRYCEAKATRSSNRSKCFKGLLQSHVRIMCLQVFPLSFIYHLEKYCKLQNLFNCVSERGPKWLSECYCERAICSLYKFMNLDCLIKTQCSTH
jgi:hypothetical protein